MHVSISDFMVASNLSGSAEADQDRKAYLTTQSELAVSTSGAGNPDSTLSTVRVLLDSLNSFQPWSDTGAGYWGPRYSDSQTIRTNLQKAQINANTRKGQTPQRAVDTSVAAPVSVWTETAKATPAAVTARAQEIARGDIWTPEQRQVVTAPIAAVGIKPSFVPAATAPSQPLPQSDSGSWFSRAVDWTFTGATQAPAAPAKPVQSPSPQIVRDVTPWIEPPTASAPSRTSSPVAPTPVEQPAPPPEKSFFGGQDILKMVQSFTGAAAQVGTAAISSQAARSQAKTRVPLAPAAPIVLQRRVAPAAPGPDMTMLAIGGGVALLAVVGLVLVIKSRNEDEDEDD